jgi:hypothetical protein
MSFHLIFLSPSRHLSKKTNFSLNTSFLNVEMLNILTNNSNILKNTSLIIIKRSLLFRTCCFSILIFVSTFMRAIGHFLITMEKFIKKIYIRKPTHRSPVVVRIPLR